jgi:hypothetical protein
MGGFGGNSQSRRYLRLLGLSIISLTVANCASGNVSSQFNPNLNAIATNAESVHEHQRIIHGADQAALRHAPSPPSGRSSIVGTRPNGCPHAFCGCEASLYLFGQIHPELNLAANWITHFPRSEPAAGMAAVRKHHVFVLISQVNGTDWLVHDGNSGHGLIREHVRSISGYIVVNPKGTVEPRVAQAE